MRALAVIVILLLTPTAAAADVRVVRPDKPPKPVELEGDMALHAVLAEADVRPFELDALDVVADGTQRFRLDRSTAFSRQDAAVLSEGEDGVHFAFDGDELVADRIDLKLVEGTVVTVTATASPARVEPGELVAFSATVAGVETGETATVRWTFPGGERKAGVEVTYRFDQAGTANVVVGATTADDPTGDSAIVTVVVAEPDATPTPTPSATPTAAATPSPSPASVPGFTPSEPTRPKPTPEATATATPASTFGRRVAGELLDTSALAAAPAPADRAPVPDQPVEDDDGGLSLSPGAVALLVLAALLVAGFKLDMRRARPHWT